MCGKVLFRNWTSFAYRSDLVVGHEQRSVRLYIGRCSSDLQVLSYREKV